MTTSLGRAWQIDDVLTFYVQVRDPGTGNDAEPDTDGLHFSVFEEGNTTAILGPTAITDSLAADGAYFGQVTLSAANGFENGKCYVIRITAVCGGITSSELQTFQVSAAAGGGGASVLRSVTMDNDTATTTSFFVTGDIGDADDAYKGLWVTMQGDTQLAPRLVTAFNGTTGEYTVSPAFLTTPANGTVFEFARYENPYAEGGVVWDSQANDYQIPGSFGEAVGNLFSRSLRLLSAHLVNAGSGVGSIGASDSTTVTLDGPPSISAEVLLGTIMYIEGETTTGPVVVVTAYDEGTGMVTFTPSVATPFPIGQFVSFARPTATLLDHPDGVETGVDHRKALRAMSAVIAGERSGTGSGEETFDAVDNPGTTRVVSTLDAENNRVNITNSLE